MEHDRKTWLIRVYGIVQGVGFRPFVSRIASLTGVTGSVANKGSYVEIYVQGDETQREVFLKYLRENAPERSSVLKTDIKVVERPIFADFQIIESEREAGDIFVSPDIATCPKCRKELFDPGNRRYLHPFINCTACGPRLSILDSMPYDRERTSMGEFPMCPECEYEYTHAESRRYDAQPVCCNDCGPEVYILKGKAASLPEGQADDPASACGSFGRITGRKAITLARKAIMDGKIIAVKGIGGFHLCCDALNPQAVARLRFLKNRPAKPFAVMMRDLETVRRECHLEVEKIPVLEGHQKPIILLKKKKDGHLAPFVAPGNPKVGVMLPYAPVQMLLFDYNDEVRMTTDCLVMTSGNLSGAPICRTDEEAVEQISSFCDLILSHNRKIRLRVDDSVMDYYKGEPYMIRRSRGYAPLPVWVSRMGEGQVLAVGGELKNTFCLGKGQLFYPSPYVGDMADLRTVQALSGTIRRMEELLEIRPQIVACDMHPKYNTGLVAREQGLPVLPVQHHYAHVVSCMAENDYGEPVIGVSFDGTGYGTDGTIWGGEFLKADYHGFERLGSIRPFSQIGGDASAKEGWRIAAAMVNAIYGEQAAEVTKKLEICEESIRCTYEKMARKKINSVTSTSAGRLFDAVSAILGIRFCSTFEGEASMALEFAAEEWEEAHSKEVLYSICEEALSAIRRCGDLICTVAEKSWQFQNGELYAAEEAAVAERPGPAFWLATDRLVRYLTDRYLAGQEKGALAYLFHVLLAEMIAEGCMQAAKLTGLKTCALSGGVFQNQLLLRLCDEKLTALGFRVLRHSLIPPNDGGIALGQAVVAMNYLQRKENICV